jgi:terminase large subunit-like protein
MTCIAESRNFTVPVATLRNQVRKLQTQIGQQTPADHPTLQALRQDPAEVMRLAGLNPDPWQAALLRSNSRRLLMLASRQSGKSQAAAAVALLQALLVPDSLILILSRALRQSSEFFRDKFMRLYNRLDRPVLPMRPPSALSVELVNGSRVISLPGDGDSIVGYSGVSLLLIDEASRVPDSLYRMVRPMLAVSRGTLVALSTPYGKRGWFYEEWDKADIARHRGEPSAWRTVKITADQCPRIAPEFLAEERAALGDRWYRQEYFCSFEDTVDAVFASTDIEAALTPNLEPVWID